MKPISIDVSIANVRTDIDEAKVISAVHLKSKINLDIFCGGNQISGVPCCIVLLKILPLMYQLLL